MVAASTVWATALRQLAELPSTSERTITLQVALNPLPAFNKLLVLPTINPAEWNPLVTDLKVSQQRHPAVGVPVLWRDTLGQQHYHGLGPLDKRLAPVA